MINVSNVYVQYGDRILLNKVNLVIGEKEKVGLVGRNGAGKSTMLKIIAGEMSPHEGNVSFPRESTLGFLHQEMDIPKGKTVMEETLTAFEHTKQLEARIQEINEEMARRTDYESDSYHQLLDEYATLTNRFSYLDGESMEANAEKVLKGLGFTQKDFERLTDEFSGGWQMRIELAKMLLRHPDYLLLDEPTNHLDIESIIWLESFLQDYTSTVIVISHDKEFLDNITKRTVEVELGNLYDYKAGYTEYVEMRAERREKQIAAYENQQRVIADRERTINRFMAKATKTKMAQSMQKQLDKMERIEIDQQDVGVMDLRFPPAPRSGQVVVEAKSVVKKYDDLLVLDEIDFKMDRGDRVAFVGQNGQGKTTLAKMLISKLSISSGTIQLGHNVEIGYYAQNQSDTLYPKSTVLETMEQDAPAEMRPKLRSILGAFMFSGEDVDKKVSVLSGGERARLALACLLLRPFNLLVLDEPTNHLDMLSKDVLKQALIDYDGSLIVVSHDRDFLAGLTNRTLEFRDRQLHNHIGDVNAFLEKRALDNMRDVELRNKASNKEEEAPAPKPTLSYEERKKLLRAIDRSEKQVEKLEEKIATFEEKMLDPSFYEQADADDQLKTYGQLKTDLDEAMEEWEMTQLELDKYE
ncbi:MAG TPA: ABC-F family ATP-binding cassette domain-containing protein [Saprospiraceae bacterium]|nr:ABC-F family ATP-binding cassette domain-containing protein [Saprospiraceae bacterium]